MSNSTSTDLGRKRAAYSPFRLFDWIDSFKSESHRHITRNIISGILLAAISGTIVLIWKWISENSKSFWNVLQYPVSLKLWIVLLIAVVVFWLFYLFRSKKTHDPNYIEVFRFLIDENRAKGFKYLIEYGICRPIDKAIPLILKSDTFDAFLANAGLILDIDDSVQVAMNVPFQGGMMAFGVPSRTNPMLQEHAKFVLQRGKIVQMNNAAHNHFDWAYTTFKKQYKL